MARGWLREKECRYCHVDAFQRGEKLFAMKTS